jgi:hypothetical protein
MPRRGPLRRRGPARRASPLAGPRRHRWARRAKWITSGFGARPPESRVMPPWIPMTDELWRSSQSNTSEPRGGGRGGTAGEETERLSSNTLLERAHGPHRFSGYAWRTGGRASARPAAACSVSCCLTNRRPGRLRAAASPGSGFMIPAARPITPICPRRAHLAATSAPGVRNNSRPPPLLRTVSDLISRKHLPREYGRALRGLTRTTTMALRR